MLEESFSSVLVVCKCCTDIHVNLRKRTEMPHRTKPNEPLNPPQQRGLLKCRAWMWVAQLSQAWHWKLPKSTLELVVVGRMHGIHVRPGQLLRQGLARLHHHSPAWPHRPIKTGVPLLFPSHLSLSLYLSLFLSHSLSRSSQSMLTHSSFPTLPL